MALMLLFAWVVFSKIAYLSLLFMMFLISYKNEGNSLLPNSQIRINIAFCKAFDRFYHLGLLKRKGGLNDYLLPLLFFICFSIISFFLLDFLTGFSYWLLWIFFLTLPTSPPPKGGKGRFH